MFFTRPLVAAGLALAFFVRVIAGAQSDWTSCSDPEFQFVLTYPPGLVHSTDPGTPACAFKTKDGEFSVEAVLQPEAADEGDTLASRYQKESDLLGDTVTYRKRAETWFVLSGVTQDGTEFYRKQYTKGSKWIALRITYPHARHEKYDRWAARIEKSFVPFAVRERNSEPKPSVEEDGD